MYNGGQGQDSEWPQRAMEAVWGRNRLEKGDAWDFTLCWINNSRKPGWKGMGQIGVLQKISNRPYGTLTCSKKHTGRLLDNTSKKVRKVAWSHRLPVSLPSVEFPITQELQGEIWTNVSHEWFAYQWSWMRQGSGLQDLLHLFQLYISTDLWARPIVGQLRCCTGDSSRGTGEGGTPSSSKAWRWPEAWDLGQHS